MRVIGRRYLGKNAAVLKRVIAMGPKAQSYILKRNLEVILMATSSSSY